MAERDPACHLCPGNRRANGQRTPDYAGTYVFDNDFAALRPDTPDPEAVRGGVLLARSERGICRVLCYSPRHDATLATLPEADVRRVIDAWADEFDALAAIDWIGHVLVFENQGPMMGASSPHPHGQIWAQETVPVEPAKELAALRAYAGKGRCLLCDYARQEEADGSRTVVLNEQFVAVVPYWAVWPFEILILPRGHAGTVSELDDLQRDAFAEVLRAVLRRYDALFDVPFPYSLGLHQRPTDGEPHREWHLHAHLYPPLLRSASVRKFMVGYELLGEPQRDITAEDAALELRKMSDQ